MRASSVTLFVAIGLVAALAPGLPASAHPVRYRRHHSAPSPPADAVELGSLAPPTRLGTLEQTYGDAAIARDQIRRGEPAMARADLVDAAAAGAPGPCDPRSAATGGYVCRNGSGRVGYGQFYAFTPSHVSAPTVVGQDPAVQPPITPPVTSLFYRFDGLVSGARD